MLGFAPSTDNEQNTGKFGRSKEQIAEDENFTAFSQRHQELN